MRPNGITTGHDAKSRPGFLRSALLGPTLGPTKKDQDRATGPQVAPNHREIDGCGPTIVSTRLATNQEVAGSSPAGPIFSLRSKVAPSRPRDASRLASLAANGQSRRPLFESFASRAIAL